MYTVDFEYRQRELVGVKFENEIKIGIISSFRFTNTNKPLYCISGVGGYVPPNMIIKLTEEQKNKYNKLINKYVDEANEYQEKMRKAQEKIANISNEIFEQNSFYLILKEGEMNDKNS